ncbi:MAG: hypothetical protein ACYDDW_19000 [Dermatophilaceae bacterium]
MRTPSATTRLELVDRMTRVPRRSAAWRGSQITTLVREVAEWV